MSAGDTLPSTLCPRGGSQPLERVRDGAFEDYGAVEFAVCGLQPTAVAHCWVMRPAISW
jgi:hypothetical protein